MGNTSGKKYDNAAVMMAAMTITRTTPNAVRIVILRTDKRSTRP